MGASAEICSTFSRHSEGLGKGALRNQEVDPRGQISREEKKQDSVRSLKEREEIARGSALPVFYAEVVICIKRNMPDLKGRWSRVGAGRKGASTSGWTPAGSSSKSQKSTSKS